MLMILSRSLVFYTLKSTKIMITNRVYFIRILILISCFNRHGYHRRQNVQLRVIVRRGWNDIWSNSSHYLHHHHFLHVCSYFLLQLQLVNHYNTIKYNVHYLSLLIDKCVIQFVNCTAVLWMYDSYFTHAPTAHNDIAIMSCCTNLLLKYPFTEEYFNNNCCIYPYSINWGYLFLFIFNTNSL